MRNKKKVTSWDISCAEVALYIGHSILMIASCGMPNAWLFVICCHADRYGLGVATHRTSPDGILNPHVKC